jgi:fermentation-respiration switch protein FrsA (DUF1100 family)
MEVDGRAVRFTVPGQMGDATFEGTVSEDGQRMTGEIDARPRNGEPTQATFELARTVEVLDMPEPFAFSGAVDVQGVMQIDMTIALARTPGGNWVGHIDVPAQMTYGFVLADVEETEDGIRGVMPGPVPAIVQLRISDDERHLAGTMTQGPIEMAIDFERHDGYVGGELRRPQHPVPPYPYEVTEVTIHHPDGHELAGTLTVPDAETNGPGPYAAAVLISGSGAQDRDESLLGHKPFLVLADHLTRQGIAVLRYDDRGFAGSTGNHGLATSADFATDALAAVQFARRQESIDGSKVGLIGHSEGGLIAPMVAGLSSDVAFAVLLAGPGVPGDEILLLQGELIRRAEGGEMTDVEAAQQTQRQILELVRTANDVPALREAARPLIEAQVVRQGIEDEETIRESTDAALDQLTSPWMRAFIQYDPRPALAAMHCPVLAINGTLDLQVWHEQNLDEIQRVMREAGRDITIRRYEGLNHLFQPAETGAVSEYARIEITMDEQVLRDIAQWIREKLNDDDDDADAGERPIGRAGSKVIR